MGERNRGARIQNFPVPQIDTVAEMKEQLFTVQQAKLDKETEDGWAEEEWGEDGWRTGGWYVAEEDG